MILLSFKFSIVKIENQLILLFIKRQKTIMHRICNGNRKFTLKKTKRNRKRKTKQLKCEKKERIKPKNSYWNCTCVKIFLFTFINFHGSSLSFAYKTFNFELVKYFIIIFSSSVQTENESNERI